MYIGSLPSFAIVHAVQVHQGGRVGVEGRPEPLPAAPQQQQQHPQQPRATACHAQGVINGSELEQRGQLARQQVEPSCRCSSKIVSGE